VEGASVVQRILKILSRGTRDGGNVVVPFTVNSSENAAPPGAWNART
jgi:hypothetical protein